MWAPPPSNLSLPDGEAHVWLADLNTDADTRRLYWDLLAADERERAGKFRFEKDRNHFVVARGILRMLLGRYLNLPPAGITFQYTSFGKPFFPEGDPLQFNLSHAGGMALLGFTLHHTIGVDIEQIRPEIELKEIATHFFSNREVETLLALPDNQTASGFYNCWTRKEAFIKAEGSGLSFPLDQFEVSLKPGDPATLNATHWDPEEASKWSLFSFMPADAFAGAMAIKGDITKISYWCWKR